MWPSGGRGLGGEHHLVADVLDHPAAVVGDRRGGGRLESFEERGQFVVVQVSGKPGVADHVGESHRQRPQRAFALRLARSGDRCRQVPAPHIRLQLIDARHGGFRCGTDPFRQWNRGIARDDARLDLGQHQVGLPLRQPRHALTDGPSSCGLLPNIRRGNNFHAPKVGDRRDVELGEVDLVVLIGRKSQRRPQPPRLSLRHPRLLGHLRARIPPRSTEQRLFDAALHQLGHLGVRHTQTLRLCGASDRHPRLRIGNVHKSGHRFPAGDTRHSRGRHGAQSVTAVIEQLKTRQRSTL